MSHKQCLFFNRFQWNLLNPKHKHVITLSKKQKQTWRKSGECSMFLETTTDMI